MRLFFLAHLHQRRLPHLLWQLPPRTGEDLKEYNEVRPASWQMLLNFLHGHPRGTFDEVIQKWKESKIHYIICRNCCRLNCDTFCNKVFFNLCNAVVGQPIKSGNRTLIDQLEERLDDQETGSGSVQHWCSATLLCGETTNGRCFKIPGKCQRVLGHPVELQRFHGKLRNLLPACPRKPSSRVPREEDKRWSMHLQSWSNPRLMRCSLPYPTEWETLRNEKDLCWGKVKLAPQKDYFFCKKLCCFPKKHTNSKTRGTLMDRFQKRYFANLPQHIFCNCGQNSTA